MDKFTSQDRQLPPDQFRRREESNTDQRAGAPTADSLTPDERYQELFVDIQMQRIYPDGKIFVDSAPRRAPEAILSDYRLKRDLPDFDLTTFVHENFDPQHPDPSNYVAPPGRTLIEHIDRLWDTLTRRPEDHPPSSSLLPLPKPYVIPGGRFCEIYYWDTYFTILGLAASQRFDLMESMADNFAYLIETYGHVPNGNRNYYLTRSQPPLFAYIVELFEKHDVRQAVHYLPMLFKEHSRWMEGARHLRPGEQSGNVVCLNDGTLLNRYWDHRETARPQSYREDVLTARRGNRPHHRVFRDTRAGAACGWDFSSRWFDDPQDMSTIRTTSILPVDLNCFIYKLESVIADLCELANYSTTAGSFRKLATTRASAIQQIFWSPTRSAYLDYDWERKQTRPRLNAATVTPLFCRLASAEQARALADTVARELIDPGGLATTRITSGQQWDQPNGWAPLQWIAIAGLKNYGEDNLADDIADRWLRTVAKVYGETSKLVEKYDIQAVGVGSGGEYALQDGFGWTNGVTRTLLEMYPNHDARLTRSRDPSLAE